MVEGYICPAPPDASKVTFEINRVTCKEEISKFCLFGDSIHNST